MGSVYVRKEFVTCILHLLPSRWCLMRDKWHTWTCNVGCNCRNIVIQQGHFWWFRYLINKVRNFASCWHCRLNYSLACFIMLNCSINSFRISDLCVNLFTTSSCLGPGYIVTNICLPHPIVSNYVFFKLY